MEPKCKVVVKPIGNFDCTRFAKQLLKATDLFDCDLEISNEKIPIYEEDLVSARQQYDAMKIIIRIFNSKKGDEKIIGLTSEDVFVPKLNFIFGLAEVVGGVGLVSTARLDSIESDSDLVDERVFKEVAHELGHLFNLKHCTDSNCIMSFANSIFDVDRKKPFLCSECKRKSKLEIDQIDEE